MKIMALLKKVEWTPPFFFACLYFVFEYIRPQDMYGVFRILPLFQIIVIGHIISCLLSPQHIRIKNGLSIGIIVFMVQVYLSMLVNDYPLWQSYFDFLTDLPQAKTT